MVGYRQRRSINTKNVTTYCVRKTPVKQWEKNSHSYKNKNFKHGNNIIISPTPKYRRIMN